MRMIKQTIDPYNLFNPGKVSELCLSSGNVVDTTLVSVVS